MTLQRMRDADSDFVQARGRFPEKPSDVHQPSPLSGPLSGSCAAFDGVAEQRLRARIVGADG
jgi:hypothetical protein